MTDNPWGDTEVSVTLKQHAKFDAPWLVIRGKDTDSVKRELEKATGQSGEGITLASLVYNGAEHFKKVGDLGTTLEATVIPDDEPAAEAPSPAAEPEPEEEPQGVIDHVGVIGKITAKKDLQDYYLANREVFDSDPEKQAALQERFAEVKG